MFGFWTLCKIFNIYFYFTFILFSCSWWFSVIPCQTVWTTIVCNGGSKSQLINICWSECVWLSSGNAMESIAWKKSMLGATAVVCYHRTLTICFAAMLRNTHTLYCVEFDPGVTPGGNTILDLNIKPPIISYSTNDYIGKLVSRHNSIGRNLSECWQLVSREGTLYHTELCWAWPSSNIWNNNMGDLNEYRLYRVMLTHSLFINPVQCTTLFVYITYSKTLSLWINSLSSHLC